VILAEAPRARVVALDAFTVRLESRDAASAPWRLVATTLREPASLWTWWTEEAAAA